MLKLNSIYRQYLIINRIMVTFRNKIYKFTENQVLENQVLENQVLENQVLENQALNHDNDHDDDKQTIINLFNNKVKGKDIYIENQNEKHCGKEGHWLETQMGIKHNANNEPDIHGYEMKTGEKVTTFIDKSPDVMFIEDGVELPKRNIELKKNFWQKYASAKNTEHLTIGGWSVDKYNNIGQKMVIDDKNNVHIIYDYNYDTRDRAYKDNLKLNEKPHTIMQWYSSSLNNAIENKFNKKGFFKCKKENNQFVKICFGKPITFEIWINELKKGIIYHDGYSKVNGRGRHVFRASNKFWDSLITEEY